MREGTRRRSNGQPRNGARRPRGIVFMAPGFPASERDSTCLPAIQNYVAGLGAMRPDLDVHVIAFQYPYARRQYRWNGVTVHALGGANRPGVRRVPTWALATYRFTGLRRRLDIAALHTFWLTDTTMVGQRLGRTFRVRHVASIGGQDALASNPYLRRIDLDGLVVTAGSQFAASAFSGEGAGARRGQQAGRPEVHVIPLGLDTEHLVTIAPPERRDIDIIGVGSLIPLKRFEAFLDVIAAVRREFPRLRACIVGDGPERDTLAARIAHDGLEDAVELTGELPRDNAFRRMLRARVLLHCSRYESQGYVFLEALTAGLEVVCHDVGHTGDSDRVHRGATTEDLAGHCARLLRDPRPPEPQPVPTVADTVRAFEALYGV